MHAGESPNNFQVTQLLSADIHEQIFTFQIFAIQSLNGVLHSGGKFSIGSSKLLQQHVAESWIRSADVDGIHKLFDVVVHDAPLMRISSRLVARTVAGVVSERECETGWLQEYLRIALHLRKTPGLKAT